MFHDLVPCILKAGTVVNHVLNVVFFPLLHLMKVLLFTCIFHISDLIISKIPFESSHEFQNTLSLFIFKSFELYHFLNPTLIIPINYISNHKKQYKILGKFYILIFMVSVCSVFLLLLLLCKCLYHIWNLQMYPVLPWFWNY